MHQHEIARRNIFTLHQEQTDLALYAARLAEALKISDGLNLHGDGKTHSFNSLRFHVLVPPNSDDRILLFGYRRRLQYVVTPILSLYMCVYRNALKEALILGWCVLVSGVAEYVRASRNKAGQ